MRSPVMIRGERFYDLLMSSDVDTNLVIDGVDGAYGFVWNNGDDFTAIGREYFRKILEAKYEILQNGTIVINCGDENLGEMFLAACAGHIPSSVYKSWFINI